MSAADALRVSAIRGSGYVWPGNLKRLPLPSGCEISHAARLSGFPKRKGNAMLSGSPQGSTHDTRNNHTRTIAYPIRICCPNGKHWLKWASLATSFRKPTTAHVPPPSDGVSGRPVRTSFAKDSKESLLNLGLLWWSKSYQNTKT